MGKQAVIKRLNSGSSMSFSFDEFVEKYENSTEIEFNNTTKETKIIFTNFVPVSKFQKAKSYTKHNDGYTCGWNAINIQLKIWGYNKQLNNYHYNWMWSNKPSNRYGQTGRDMYTNNIKNTFKYCGFSSDWRVIFGSPSYNASYIDDNDYSSYSIMLVSGEGFQGHYIMIIGVSKCKTWYFVTDQSLKVWLISWDKIKPLLYYRSNGGWSQYDIRSYYKCG